MQALIFVYMSVALVLQNGDTNPIGIDLTTLLTILGPIVVAFATWVVGRIKASFSGVAIVWIIMPVIAAGVAAVQYFLDLGAIGNFWIQLVLNMAATTFHQMQKQLKEKVASKPTTP